MKENKLKQALIKPKQEWILTDDDPHLHRPSDPVDQLTDDDWVIINQMISYIDCCYSNEYHKYNIRPGIAIAAPQMGLNKQVIYVHFEDNGKEYKYLLANPKITSFSNMFSYIPNGEGCLSVPKDVYGNVKRNYKIIVEAIDLTNGEPIRIVASDLLSICLQHEIDHLNGVLYVDRINQEEPNYASKDWIKIG